MRRRTSDIMRRRTSDALRKLAIASRPISKQGREKLLASRGRSKVTGTLEERLPSVAFERIRPYLKESIDGDGFIIIDFKKLKVDNDASVKERRENGIELDAEALLYVQCVDELCSAYEADDLPDDVPGDWHHGTPLSIHGSECDARNIDKVSVGKHVLLHACLCVMLHDMAHLGLNYAVMMMINATSLSLQKAEEIIADMVRPLF
jgi:hypothetical protein